MSYEFLTYLYLDGQKTFGLNEEQKATRMHVIVDHVVAFRLRMRRSLVFSSERLL
jgi:hypothetical protein